MSNQRYTEEFKIEAVKQATERCLPLAEVAARLGMPVHSLYAGSNATANPQEKQQQEDDQQAELRRLRAELKRLTEERDILKRPPHTLPRSLAEVCFHQQAVGGVSGSASMTNPQSASKRLLRLAIRA